MAPVPPVQHGQMSEGRELLGFCVTANVRQQTNQGEGGLQVRRGIKHFAAGAKVWVLPVQWGDGGDQVIVAGRHRGSRGPYIRMVIARRHLENFRVQGVYSPALMRTLTKPSTRYHHTPALWDSPGDAEDAAARWNTPLLQAQFDDGLAPFTVMVSDPPPLELSRNGITYYLAHFNYRTARYSASPPPTGHAVS